MALSRVTPRTAFLGAALAALALGGCNSGVINPIVAPTMNPIVQVQTRGFVLQDGMLEQIPPGSSRDQVTFVLGTPTTSATFDTETYYYITQQVERVPGLPPKVIDQRVIAVYFDKTQRVTRVANYTLQDGKIFDAISRTTPTGGKEQTFLGQIFQNFFR